MTVYCLIPPAYQASFAPNRLNALLMLFSQSARSKKQKSTPLSGVLSSLFLLFTFASLR
jgi:hypothetical protein